LNFLLRCKLAHNKNLIALSIHLTPAIQQKEPVTQAILINKLSQEVATGHLIDQALLARQILQEGSQVPAIYSNKAAQEAIKIP
jgi:hypothetical protein